MSGHRPFKDIKAESVWKQAGYSEWPPPWREIIPKLTDSQITELLDKMPKMGKTFK